MTVTLKLVQNAACDKGHVGTANPAVHHIADDGTLSPSWVCPFECSWHEFAVLDGWIPNLLRALAAPSVSAEEGQMPDLPRPWCCPDPALCAPLVQLRDGESMPIDIPQSGQSWTCFGQMAPSAFIYNGVEHVNDLHSCHYTPLKGVVMYQENRADWESLATYYHLAVRKLDIVEAAPQPPSATTGDE